jgi:allene oxide cyclase
MRKALSLGFAALLAVFALSYVAQAHTTHGSHETTVTVIEHATTDTVIDTGAAGDTTGDLLTWHNKVYDKTDTSVVGHDQGQCIRISPKQGSWECTWITWIGSDSITVEGPYYDTRNSTLAITGGTGKYSEASGQMGLVAMNGGTEYAFVFELG